MDDLEAVKERGIRKLKWLLMKRDSHRGRRIRPLLEVIVGDKPMLTRITRVLSDQEYDDLVEFGQKTEGYYSNDPRLFTPGMAFHTPWVYAPPGHPYRIAAKRMMVGGPEASNAGFLSSHYWRDWASKRAPLCVVGPNGEWWEIDRKSSNGDGWTVMGEIPTITCSPSIVLRGYHGYLRNGEFTADLEGRGENGVRP